MSKEAMKLALEALEWCHGGEPCGTAEAITALRKALAEQPSPPPECKTEAEKTAYAFGWFKALESVREQEPVAWKNAAIRLGEELSSVGPDGYYDMTAEQWLDWAMDQRPQGKNSLPAQRTWVGLTDEEAFQICVDCGCLSEDWLTLLDAIEAKLKEKNT
jgi:hypothetical protein